MDGLTLRGIYLRLSGGHGKDLEGPENISGGRFRPRETEGQGEINWSEKYARNKFHRIKKNINELHRQYLYLFRIPLLVCSKKKE